MGSAALAQDIQVPSPTPQDKVGAEDAYRIQFRADTLESRIAPGVFACGEVLDIDGDCGGYNLQWAWSSGWLAGRLGADGSQEKPV